MSDYRFEVYGPKENDIVFICKKEERCDNKFGKHVLYSFCNLEGIDCPFVINEYQIHSFVVHGGVRDCMLTWHITHGCINEDYTLHRDNRAFVSHPCYDIEWTSAEKDTLRLIHDIKRMGLETRKEIDSFFRELYKNDIEIELLEKRYHLFLNFDLNLSGTHLEGPAYSKSYELFDYKNKIRKAHMDWRDVISFLKKEREIRDISIKQLHLLNNEFRQIVSQCRILRLKDGVSVLNEEQLYDCLMVETVILPPSVKTIRCTAFNYRDSLKYIYVSSKEPVRFMLPPGRNGSIRTKALFFVPKELVDIYKSGSWTKHWNVPAENISGVEMDSLN